MAIYTNIYKKKINSELSMSQRKSLHNDKSQFNGKI